MDNSGIKVRIFDMAHGLREYENIKIIRIISKDYNLLIMKDYLPIIGEIEGSVDIKSDSIEMSFKDIKAFYMKQNEDGKTVAAVDLEVPGAGELMGGSQREEDYDKLVARMEELGMEKEGLDWYLNLRKFGGCVHSGFGMGFERLLIYLTGVENIRDVIPYPRTPGNCEF